MESLNDRAKAAYRVAKAYARALEAAGDCDDRDLLQTGYRAALDRAREYKRLSARRGASA